MPTMQLFKRRAACALSSRKLSGLSVAQSDFSISLGAQQRHGQGSLCASKQPVCALLVGPIAAEFPLAVRRKLRALQKRGLVNWEVFGPWVTINQASRLGTGIHRAPVLSCSPGKTNSAIMKVPYFEFPYFLVLATRVMPLLLHALYVYVYIYMHIRLAYQCVVLGPLKGQPQRIHRVCPLLRRRWKMRPFSMQSTRDASGLHSRLSGDVDLAETPEERASWHLYGFIKVWPGCLSHIFHQVQLLFRECLVCRFRFSRHVYVLPGAFLHQGDVSRDLRYEIAVAYSRRPSLRRYARAVLPLCRGNRRQGVRGSPEGSLRREPRPKKSRAVWFWP